ncbi:hypothetical protein B0J11DRAFT_432261 [Dendryphion nanum]|uniref:Zn(2)-C6 fungal-type domain-containing protein n=1 Tax=Dendryphion nanum TaxID=256645 RepID=A0A9P9DW98_9PLEO|nr:hypothetical protein B0J11DRAFT_432261 [Dendryphion nanum]
MLGYISSTRKKSCVACVKAKRRCDLGYPACARCSSKNLECSYPNPTVRVRAAKVVVRQTTPDLVPETSDAPASSDSSSPEINDMDQYVDYEPFKSVITNNLGDSSSPDSYDSLKESPPLTIANMPQIWEPVVLEQRQVIFIVNKLCTFIPSLAYSGQAMFMHEGLWQNCQPEAYQDSCMVSALYLAKTESNQCILANSINTKIAALVAASNSWSLEQHLAAVQSLIIYQIIRLFDPNLGLQELAHKQNKLLEIWTAQLWKRSFIESDKLPNCRQSWIFQESLRRTVLISVFLRGAWSTFVRGGFCDIVPILARLPIMQDGTLWNSTSTEWAAKEPCTRGAGKGWVTLGEYSSAWSADGAVEELPGLERLMLAACCGRMDPRLLEE